MTSSLCKAARLPDAFLGAPPPEHFDFRVDGDSVELVGSGGPSRRRATAAAAAAARALPPPAPPPATPSDADGATLALLGRCARRRGAGALPCVAGVARVRCGAWSWIRDGEEARAAGVEVVADDGLVDEENFQDHDDLTVIGDSGFCRGGRGGGGMLTEEEEAWEAPSRQAKVDARRAGLGKGYRSRAARGIVGGLSRRISRKLVRTRDPERVTAAAQIPAALSFTVRTNAQNWRAVPPNTSTRCTPHSPTTHVKRDNARLQLHHRPRRQAQHLLRRRFRHAAWRHHGPRPRARGHHLLIAAPVDLLRRRDRRRHLHGGDRAGDVADDANGEADHRRHDAPLPRQGVERHGRQPHADGARVCRRPRSCSR